MSELPSGWRENKLKDLLKIKGGKRLPKGKSLTSTRTNHPYIRITDLENNSIKKEQLQFITDDIFSNISRYIVNTNDVILSIVGTIGLVSIINNNLNNANLTENCVKLIALNEEIINYKYIFYYLISNNGQYEINKNTVGAVQKKLPIYGIENINIKLPSIKEQKAIANILSSFDNKIELLKEQNRTLETLSQTIFKEWFVDFNYPNATGEMIHSEIGNIPKGWRVGKVKDIVNIYDSKRIPLSAREREQIKGIYPYHGATKIMDYIDKYIFDGTYLLLAEDGSVIDDNGYPILQYVWGKFWVNNHTHILQGKNGFSTELLYVLFKKSKVASIVNGAVQLKINQTNLLKYCVLIANDVVLSNFNNLIKPIFKKIKNNSSQIQTLQKTRDTLLPKLMSGKLRVKGFEDD